MSGGDWTEQWSFTALMCLYAADVLVVAYEVWWVLGVRKTLVVVAANVPSILRPWDSGATSPSPEEQLYAMLGAARVVHCVLAAFLGSRAVQFGIYAGTGAD